MASTPSTSDQTGGCNFGNSGKQLCDKDGNLITDIHGVKCTNQNTAPTSRA